MAEGEEAVTSCPWGADSVAEAAVSEGFREAGEVLVAAERPGGGDTMRARPKKTMLFSGVVVGRMTALVVFAIGLPWLAFAAEIYPKRVANIQIYDQAHVLDEKAKARAEQFLSLLKREKNIDFCGYLFQDPREKDILRTSSVLFEAWNVGRDVGGKGLLLVVDFSGKKVRLEVSYALEPFFPDSFVGYIEREQMVPFFQNKRYGDGIEAALELIVERAQREHSEELKNRREPVSESSLLAGGAGATAVLEKLKPESTYPQEVLDLFSPQQKPEDTFRLYVERARLRLKSPDLQLYTPSTREFLRQWVVTDAQCDHEYSRYHKAPFQTRIQGDHAVIVFPVEDRSLAPFFLQRSGKGWQVDLATMNKTIRFNHRNEWNFVSQEHPYMFAFDDMTFDRHGFPHKKK